MILNNLHPGSFSIILILLIFSTPSFNLVYLADFLHLLVGCKCGDGCQDPSLKRLPPECSANTLHMTHDLVRRELQDRSNDVLGMITVLINLTHQ